MTKTAVRSVRDAVVFVADALGLRLAHRLARGDAAEHQSVRLQRVACDTPLSPGERRSFKRALGGLRERDVQGSLGEWIVRLRFVLKARSDTWSAPKIGRPSKRPSARTCLRALQEIVESRMTDVVKTRRRREAIGEHVAPGSLPMRKTLALIVWLDGLAPLIFAPALEPQGIEPALYLRNLTKRIERLTAEN